MTKYRIRYSLISHEDIEASSPEEAMEKFERMSSDSLLRQMLVDSYDDMEVDEPVLVEEKRR